MIGHPPVLRGLLLPICQVRICLVHFPNKPSPLQSSVSSFVRLKCSSCSALKVIESIPTNDLAFNTSPNMLSQPHEGFHRIPGKFSNGNWPRSTENDKNVRSKPANFDSKESLRRYSVMLHRCSSKRYLNEGMAIHAQVIKSGIDPDSHLWVSLVNVYAKCGRLVCARKVLDEMPERDVVSWTALIQGFVAEGYGLDGVSLFSEMKKDGVRPNEFTLATGLKACCVCLDLEFGKQLHAEAIKVGFYSDLFVGSALVDLYGKYGAMELADRVFICMPEQNAVSWNALLSGYAQEGSLREGQVVHSLATKVGIELDEFLGCSLVDMYSKCGLAVDALKGENLPSIACRRFQAQHLHICKHFKVLFKPHGCKVWKTNTCACYQNSLDDNDFIGTALVDMYAKTRLLEDADVAFRRLTNRDLFSWTTIITGYAQTGQAEKAVNCFSQMQREGVKPNEFTLAGCLSACSQLATLDNGRQLHSMAIKCGHIGDLFVSSTIVDMYAKCGCIEDADATFEGLVSRDTISWNTMICGYSQHGLGRKLLKRLGRFEEGKEHFNSMIEVYKINPTIEHYACVVDILGRAGRFNEVERFIKAMKLTPKSTIWETVLGACKMHGNVELGERAAGKLFEIKPEEDSTYILLSNIFAAKNRWDDVRKVRKLMSSQGVKKEPGCSWVEVDGQVHVFISQDGSHPRIRDICLKLEELGQQLTSAGYTPETGNVLHNITEKEKKEHLQYHSERLALAFSLINTNPLKTVRILKNLRICGDCHDVMKLVSDITDREIIVRDIKQFHHFKAGTCSCNVPYNLN
ncbi:hypothetical protein FNV43_RR02529 [Rhamnella rubrinervis]|uniref:DYW domain-containing protein n=1 Tax=Rhamnella rubrinervis TaxID=2594499 RepID=A0A8K0HSR4_9ROSA|nr:hypothetical protein FNV43_RR02529 [Rhamnella rubrinervis]